jgi:enediyne polyketide synthase
MACRYPDASTPAQLWQNVLGRRRAFRRLPGGRLSDRYRGDGVDLTYLTHAGVLRDWEFDRQRFGIPGPLHRAADPVHWLALETAAGALADAGHPAGEGLDRDTVGVVFGNSLTGEFTRAATIRLRWPFIADAAATAMNDTGLPAELAGRVLGRLERLVKEPFPEPGGESLTGALANTIAGRVCNQFDFHGTGYTVDGACSSSLLAVITACQALAAGDCDFMLAGGVDVSLDPLELVGFARLGALAATEMRVYDADPTGFLPGEGCGVVALMRAEDAERAGRRSYAHLVGWASASDGSGGLSRPELRGQVLALRRAYRRAGLHPDEVTLIEGHGTGTAVGDHTELDALVDLRGLGTGPAALGSVKANIGHTKAAAGVAGLIKATLAVTHRVLPPTTGCARPHDLLCRPGAPLRVLDEPEPWTSAVPRAGVSSMGFGGINAHVIVEGVDGAPATALPASVRRWSARIGPAEIVFLGAENPGALGERLALLAGAARRLSQAELGDVAATAWLANPGAARYRVALVATTPDELADAAEHAGTAAAAGWDEGLSFDERHGYVLGSGPAPRVGLLFPGQAAPVRLVMPRWADRLTVPPRPGGTDGEEGTGTAVAQPAIVWQSLAALAWLRELGTVAVAACGHSLGELTALHWAGGCGAAEVLELAAARGLIMSGHGVAGTTMASLGAGADAVRPLLSDVDVVVAGYNAPDQVVVSGPWADVRVVLGRARAAGLAATELAVSHGFHSRAMRPAERPWRAVLDSAELCAPQRVVLSTITGKELSSTVDGIRELLVAQLTGPVLFADAVAELAWRCDLLVEAGPGTILTGLAAANRVGVPAVSLDCGGDPRRHAFATAVLAASAAADLDPWFAGRAFRPLAFDAEPRFVTSPCEDRAGWVRAPAVPATEPAPAPPVTVPAGGPLAVLTTHLAATLELPASSITPDRSLLGDLHLNSLQVVQVIGTVAGALGRELPDTAALTGTTVGEAAGILAGLPVAAGGDGTVAGVRPWVRPFTPRWVPFEPAGAGAEPDLVVTLEDGAGPDRLAGVLREVAGRSPNRLLIVHSGHPAAAAVGRSVAVELDSCAVVVAELPEGGRPVDPGVFAGPGRYLELRRAGDGSLWRAEMAALPAAGGEMPVPLGPGEVCLVTGGVRGITAYAAAALAERTGCTLVLTGRTSAGDPGVAAALEALRERVPAHYLSGDVADGDAAAGLLASARRYGAVRGLIHGAGVNHPRRLADVTAESLAETLRPKVSGLVTVLGQAGAGLRLVLGFGSIIGRAGLAGQAEYCVANDWLRVELERWAAAHPSCRTHVLEWSVWSGLGMGVRMDVLDTLRRRGVEPVPPELGVAAMLDLLARPDAPVTVLLTSRFPGSPTLFAGAGAGAPSWPRFAERAVVHVPGVEAVLEADLSLGSDPYLADHRIGGTPVLPAVLGLEALVQTASLVREQALPLALADLELRAPVTVDCSSGRTIRTAALAGAEGVDVVLRDGTDGFATERFRARVVAAADGPVAAVPPANAAAANPWYGTELFFHGERFRRLAGYQRLSAFRVHARLLPSTVDNWFSQFHSGQLWLGDPGGHDATLHALLACVPHRRALPVGADRFTVHEAPGGPLLVRAREITHTADDYVFDIDLVRPDGVVVARWQGLRLRAVGPLAWPDGLPARLIGPWLSRRLIECEVAGRVELMTSLGVGPLELAGGGPAVRTAVVRDTSDTAADDALALLGLDRGHGLRVDQVTDDGLVVERAGTLTVVTARIRVLESAEPIAVALALTAAGCR